MRIEQNEIIECAESNGINIAMKECYGDILNALINRAEICCYNNKYLSIRDEDFTAILTVFNPQKVKQKINELIKEGETVDS